MPKGRRRRSAKRRGGKVKASSSRRRRRRNAPPGVKAVGVGSYSRGKPKRKGGKRRRRAAAKANPPTTKRRRRRRAAAKANAPTKKRRRSRRRRAKANTPKRRRRAKSNPGSSKRRRRSRRRRHAKANSGTKRRRRSRRRHAKRNSRRRRHAKRNPGGRRRRHAKRNSSGRRRRHGRRNPGYSIGSVTGGFRARLKQLMQPQVWLPPALHGAIGVGFAFTGPSILARYTAQFGLRDTGLGGVVLSGVSTALGAGLVQGAVSLLPKQLKKGMLGKALHGIGKNVMVGGMIWTAVKLVGELVPSFGRYLPRASGMAGLGMYGGHYPGQYPSYPSLPGLGVVTSPEELVAGESLARQVSAFHGVGDFMELSGMGNAVPFQDLRGVGDWVEMSPDSTLAMENFAPAAETF